MVPEIIHLSPVVYLSAFLPWAQISKVSSGGWPEETGAGGIDMWQILALFYFLDQYLWIQLSWNRHPSWLGLRNPRQLCWLCHIEGVLKKLWYKSLVQFMTIISGILPRVWHVYSRGSIVAILQSRSNHSWLILPILDKNDKYFTNNSRKVNRSPPLNCRDSISVFRVQIINHVLYLWKINRDQRHIFQWKLYNFTINKTL